MRGITHYWYGIKNATLVFFSPLREELDYFPRYWEFVSKFGINTINQNRRSGNEWTWGESGKAKDIITTSTSMILFLTLSPRLLAFRGDKDDLSAEGKFLFLLSNLSPQEKKVRRRKVSLVGRVTKFERKIPLLAVYLLLFLRRERKFSKIVSTSCTGCDFQKTREGKWKSVLTV